MSARSSRCRGSVWDSVFPEPAMTVAAIGNLAYHDTIFELNVESYRHRAATRTRAAAIANDRYDDKKDTTGQND